MMYPCRGVLHTPYKCPHSGQTDRPIWSDGPMCHFVLTPSIHELFTPSNYRSLPEAFVGCMQYVPTMIRKYYAMIRSFRSLPGSFVERMQYAPTRVRKCYVMIRSFRSPSGSFVGRMQYAPTLPDKKKKISKCFCDAFWGSKSSQNVLEMLFETQDWVKIFLRYFLRLKIEFKCFCGTFWGSKSN